MWRVEHSNPKFRVCFVRSQICRAEIALPPRLLSSCVSPESFCAYDVQNRQILGSAIVLSARQDKDQEQNGRKSSHPVYSAADFDTVCCFSLPGAI